MVSRYVARDPPDCSRCLYLADCCAYWRSCPYDGRPVDEKEGRARLCKGLEEG